VSPPDLHANTPEFLRVATRAVRERSQSPGWPRVRTTRNPGGRYPRAEGEPVDDVCLLVGNDIGDVLPRVVLEPQGLCALEGGDGERRLGVLLESSRAADGHLEGTRKRSFMRKFGQTIGHLPYI